MSPLTYFEYGTLAALHAFARARLDAVILEVGLGGRLDAVNIVDADVAVVTTIDLDHMDYLGPTRADIAYEKAGIFRAGRPVVCAEPDPPSDDDRARARASVRRSCRSAATSATSPRTGSGDTGVPAASASACPHPALRGAYQLANAATALAVVGLLQDRLHVAAGAIRDGLCAVSLPGRFQVLPGRPAIVLDVAHNPHAARVLAATLGAMGYLPETIAVFGMLADKDIGGVIAARQRAHRPLVRRDGTGSARRDRRRDARRARARGNRAVGDPHVRRHRRRVRGGARRGGRS